MTTAFATLARKIERGLAVFLVAAISVWAASGIVLSLIPHDLARGERDALTAFAPTLEARNYASPGGVIAQNDGVTELRLKPFLGRIVWEARRKDGAALFDARTAIRLSPLDEQSARMVAEHAFAGSETLTDLRRLEHGDATVGSVDVWRATFTDGLATRLYISAASGDVIGRRNRLSAAYDGLQALYTPSGKGGLTAIPPLLACAAATVLLIAANRAAAIVLHKNAKAATTETGTKG